MRCDHTWTSWHKNIERIKRRIQLFFKSQHTSLSLSKSLFPHHTAIIYLPNIASRAAEASLNTHIFVSRIGERSNGRGESALLRVYTSLSLSKSLFPHHTAIIYLRYQILLLEQPKPHWTRTFFVSRGKKAKVKGPGESAQVLRVLIVVLRERERERE